MAAVSEIIPEALQPDVDAALDWFNGTQSDAFEVTGIIDADLVVEADTPRELKLVLCGGDTCQQRSFRVARSAEGFDVAYSETEPSDDDTATKVQSELDPPPGARRAWLDKVLGRHKFVVLVFYRGFW
ncbi:MAG: hypothetical protein H8E78_04095 [Proteobacteria bacterium]|nr:hypothetical protein [Pseudomonadota bacterium]